MTENLPYRPWDPETEGLPPPLPGEGRQEYRARLHRMEKEHEAAKSPQQRLRERKEFEARMSSFDEAVQRAESALDAFGDEEDE